MDLSWVAAVMIGSMQTRDWRKESKNGRSVAGMHALPSPSDEALRRAAAHVELSRITSAAEGQAVYETYQGVWDDDLGEHAAAVAGIL